MVIYEMREASKEKVFDLVDELHELGHQKKMILCELEDTLYDCFDSSKEEDEDSEEGKDLGFKASHNYSMRNFNDDDDKDMDMRSMYRRRRMGMRRNRMGRYV